MIKLVLDMLSLGCIGDIQFLMSNMQLEAQVLKSGERLGLHKSALDSKEILQLWGETTAEQDGQEWNRFLCAITGMSLDIDEITNPSEN